MGKGGLGSNIFAVGPCVFLGATPSFAFPTPPDAPRIILGYQVIIPRRQTDPPPPANRDTATFSRELQRLRVTAVRLAPRCAPVHAHHAVVQLEGRAPWTKFRILLETRRAAETTNGDVRFFYVTLSPSDRDPPVEHPHAFHICSVLSVTTIWWPSVELQR